MNTIRYGYKTRRRAIWKRRAKEMTFAIGIIAIVCAGILADAENMVPFIVLDVIGTVNLAVSGFLGNFA